MLNTLLLSTPIPASYFCSITNQIMAEPVFTSDGYTYEKEAIEKWFKAHHTSPKTGQKLANKQLIPNWDKKGDIFEFLSANPQLYEGDEYYLPKRWQKQFIAAIQNNQIAAIQKWLVKDGRLLTLECEGNYTTFHLASQFGSAELTEIIFAHWRKTNQFNKLKTKPIGFETAYLDVLLQKSLEEQDKEKFSLLLELGIELDQVKMETKNTLLHDVIVQGWIAPVTWLLEKGVSLEVPNAQGNTPLLSSILHNKTEIAKFLLKKGANPQAENNQQQTALYLAIEKGEIEVVQLLLEKNMGFVIVGPEKHTSLHLACREGNLAIAKLLLKVQGTNLINTLNANGDTPLHLAVKSGKKELISLLLEAGANYKKKSRQGRTRLELARQPNKNEIVDLTEQKAKVPKKTKQKQVEKVLQEQAKKIEQLEKALKQQEQRCQELESKIEKGQKMLINEFSRFRKVPPQAKKSKEPLIDIQVNEQVSSLALLSDEKLVVAYKNESKGLAILCLSSGTIDKFLCDQEKYYRGQYIRQSGSRLIKLLSSTKLISIGDFGDIRVWDLKKDEFRSVECPAHGCDRIIGIMRGAASLQLLPSGELAIGGNQSIAIWDIEEASRIKILNGHKSWVNCLQVLPNDGLASGSLDHTIKIWNINSNQCLKTLEGHTNTVSCLQLLSNNKLVSGSQDGTIKIWDLISGHCLKTFENCSPVNALQLLPGDQLVSGARDGSIKIWNVKTGAYEALQGKSGSVSCFELLPSGNLISGGENGVKMWDLSEYIQEVTLEQQTSDCRIS